MGVIALLVVVPTVAYLVFRRGTGRSLRDRVLAARPGSFAFIADTTRFEQPELVRLTGRTGSFERIVVSAEDTGIAFWADDAARPLAEIPWSSVEDVGIGPPLYGGHRNLQLKLAGGGTIEFTMVGSRLPLDVLNDMLAQRDQPGRELEE